MLFCGKAPILSALNVFEISLLNGGLNPNIVCLVKSQELFALTTVHSVHFRARGDSGSLLSWVKPETLKEEGVTFSRGFHHLGDIFKGLSGAAWWPRGVSMPSSNREGCWWSIQQGGTSHTSCPSLNEVQLQSSKYKRRSFDFCKALFSNHLYWLFNHLQAQTIAFDYMWARIKFLKYVLPYSRKKIWNPFC